MPSPVTDHLTDTHATSHPPSKPQALLLRAIPPRRPRLAKASITLEFSLAAPALAGLWDFRVGGAACLAPAALLTALLSIPAAMCTQDHLLPVLRDSALTACVPLPPLALRGKPAPAGAGVVALRVALATGVAEVEGGDTKLATSRLKLLRSSAKAVYAGADPGTPPAPHPLAALVADAAAASAAPAATPSLLAAAARAADVSGYPAGTHPATLDAALSAAGTLAAGPGAPSPLTWVRRVETLLARSEPGALLSSTAPAAECALLGTYAPLDAWASGGASLRTPGAAMSLFGVVLGEHDLPPTSPGPTQVAAAALLGEEGEEAGGSPGAGEEEEAAVGLAAGHPLLAMSEEERMLHLQAQVRMLRGVGKSHS